MACLNVTGTDSLEVGALQVLTTPRPCSGCGRENVPLTRWPGGERARVGDAQGRVTGGRDHVGRRSRPRYVLGDARRERRRTCAGAPSVSDSVAGTVPPTGLSADDRAERAAAVAAADRVLARRSPSRRRCCRRRSSRRGRCCPRGSGRRRPRGGCSARSRVTCVLPVRARPPLNVLPAIVTSRVLLRICAAPLTVVPNSCTACGAGGGQRAVDRLPLATSEAPAATVTLPLTCALFRQVTPVATLTLVCAPVSVVVQVGERARQHRGPVGAPACRSCRPGRSPGARRSACRSRG